jgi:hypothetical protein
MPKRVDAPQGTPQTSTWAWRRAGRTMVVTIAALPSDTGFQVIGSAAAAAIGPDLFRRVRDTRCGWRHMSARSSTAGRRVPRPASRAGMAKRICSITPAGGLPATGILRKLELDPRYSPVQDHPDSTSGRRSCRVSTSRALRLLLRGYGKSVVTSRSLGLKAVGSGR